jgi:uncharacterized membrane protein
MLLSLTIVLVVAAALRFGDLGLRPLWLDESMTVRIALGREPSDVPIGRVAPIASVPALFAYRPQTTDADIVGLLQSSVVQHTHPPLFYLLLRRWLALTRPAAEALARTARVLPALLGVMSVVATFLLARAADSARTGMVAAWLSAVSPLMVLIGQEARNYTLPLVCVSVAMVALVAIVESLAEDRSPRQIWWAVWVLANIAGCYAHYFVVISAVAQTLALAWVMAFRTPRRAFGALALGVAIVALAFVPWLPTFLAHSRSPEQAWMHEANPFAYIYETLDGCQAMIQGWRFETDASQRVWMLVRLALGLGFLAFLVVRIRALLTAGDSTPSLIALAWVFALTVAGLWGGSVVLQKNLMIEFRYNYVYYPALIVLVAAALGRSRPWITVAVVAVGAAHSLFMIAGREFATPGHPTEVAAILASHIEPPTLILIGEASYHETVFGLTYLLALSKLPASQDSSFAFVRRSDAYPTFVRDDADPTIFWERASHVPLERRPKAVWAWAAYFSPTDYRPAFQLDGGVRCTIDPREDGRTLDEDPPRGPFRLYRCS